MTALDLLFFTACDLAARLASLVLAAFLAVPVMLLGVASDLMEVSR